jgi:hypothetical protein
MKGAQHFTGKKSLFVSTLCMLCLCHPFIFTTKNHCAVEGSSAKQTMCISMANRHGSRATVQQGGGSWRLQPMFILAFVLALVLANLHARGTEDGGRTGAMQAPYGPHRYTGPGSIQHKGGGVTKQCRLQASTLAILTSGLMHTQKKG